MAIDTKSKRNAALLDEAVVFPDGTLGPVDRANQLGQYAAGATPPIPFVFGVDLTDDDLLYLRGIRRRTDAFVFEVLDSDLNVIGTVRPSRDTIPRVSNDTTRSLIRNVSNIYFDADEQAELSTISALIRPSVVLQSGGAYPLGVFLFGDASRPRRSWGLELSATLVDFNYVLDQKIGRVVGYPAGTNAVAAALALAQEVISTPVSVTSNGGLTGAPKGYQPTATRLSIINDLLTGAGYLPVYFDNEGTMVFRPVPDLLITDAAFTYEANQRIVADSIVESDDLLSAPNRFVVIDTAATASAYVGVFDLPASAPNSIAAGRFPIVEVVALQGLGSSAAAQAAAQAAANSSNLAFKRISFESTLEPRSDTFDIIQVLGDAYREVSWSADLRSGGRMAHEAVAVYA